MICSIRPIGNIGNRLIAYMFALSAADLTPLEMDLNVHLPEFGMIFDENKHRDLLSRDSTFVIKDLDVDDVLTLREEINKRAPRALLFDGIFQRYSLLKSVEFYRKTIFPIKPLDIDEYKEDDIVINIRAGELLSGEYFWYPLVPPEFYKEIVNRTKYNPVFIGQIQNGSYIERIKEIFPKARMIPSAGPMVDFNRLLHARRLCISVSTFSWLAALISRADEIHYPLLGFLHPFTIQRGFHGHGGVNLTPINDLRYRYYLLPILHAKPQDDYINFTKKISPISKAISNHKAADLSNIASIMSEAIDVHNGQSYIERYIDAAWSIASGEYLSVESHYNAVGRKHRYSLIGEIPSANLINISRGKAATQSSVSQWSRRATVEEDASGAVDGRFSTYGFHTDIEDCPWWCIDLGGKFNIEEIRVYNRIDSVAASERARTLIIEVSEDNERFTEAYALEKGKTFGGLDGNPLRIVLGSKIEARFLRVGLRERNYLHLSQIEVFTK